MKKLFLTLPRNIIRLFQGTNLFWQIVAVVATIVIVSSGFDWTYFVSTRNAALDEFLFPAIILGAILPIIIPVLVLAAGKIYRHARAVVTAWALAQAAIIASIITLCYKSVTGRIPPPYTTVVGDISHGFQFGFMRYSVFWGWPSSHTTIAFAMVWTLIMLYPRNLLVRYGGLLYALYIGIGVSVSIHWFSEFLAGMIIGTLIGIVVGKTFRNSMLAS